MRVWLADRECDITAVWVDSFSGNGRYLVRQLPDGSWVCDCPDFHYRQPVHCKHIRKVLARLAALVRPQPARST